MTIKTADKGLIRKINNTIILKIIREKGPVSRADIAKITGLNPATVSNNVNTLLESGIVVETGSGESSGGRKPILLQLNAGAFHVIGVDMGMSKVMTAVTDLEGNVIKKVTLYFEDKSTRKYIIDRIKQSIYDIMSESGFEGSSYIGIGIGVHGLVDPENGISIYAPAFNWRNVNIKEIMEEEFNLPVYIDNDARVMALGERWFGAAQNVDNFILINVGSGVGSGIMINGELYRGATFGAGEVGHICIADNGPKCNCGNYGCLEVMASGPALVKRMVSYIKMGGSTMITGLVEDNLTKINGEIIYKAALMGDTAAVNVLEETGRYVGLAVSNLINILNPRLILIGGGVSMAGDFILRPLVEVARRKSMKDAGENVQIIPAALKENCGVVGAATLALKDLFQGPKIQ